MKIERVLVTGATGFVGRNLVPRLASEGMEVCALVRRGANKSTVKRLSTSTSRILVGDVSKYEEIADALKQERIETVVHLAAIVQRKGTKASRQMYLRTNVDGTLNICKACLETGAKRLVHMSTADVHGPNASDQLIDESYPYAPATDYEMSKAAADKLVLDFAKNGLETIVLRPPLIYGHPGSTFLKWLFRYSGYRFILVPGDGLRLKHFIHIRNLVDSVVLAMHNGHPGRAYLVADETPVTIDQLLDTVSAVLGRRATLIHVPLEGSFVLKFQKFLPWHLRYLISWFLISRAYRMDAARTELGYRPRVNLRQGLTELHELMQGTRKGDRD